MYKLQIYFVVSLLLGKSILNASARLIVCKRKYDHITGDLSDLLHWLPDFRVEYKLCLLVYKSLHQLAPVNLDIRDVTLLTSYV